MAKDIIPPPVATFPPETHASVLTSDDRIIADFRKLTEKQKQMISHYMRTGNKLGSYKAVYYPDPNTSTAKSTIIQGCYNEFKKPHVKVVVEQIQEKAVRASKLTMEGMLNDSVDHLIEQQKEIEGMAIDSLWVLKRAALLADFNINKFIKVENGEAIYDFSTADDDDWYCIHEVVHEVLLSKDGQTQVPVGKVKIKTYDKLRALELVGKHVSVGAFKDKIELSGDENRPLTMIVRGDDAGL